MSFLTKMKSDARDRSHIEIIGNRVIKHFSTDIDIIKIATKYESISDLLTPHNICTPEIVNIDHQKHCIEFIRLDIDAHLGKTLQQAFNSSQVTEDHYALLYRLGESLGLLHRDLQLPTKSLSQHAEQGYKKNRERAFSNVSESDSRVFFHGDFSLNNIFYCNNRITIIDPIPNQITMFFIDEYGYRIIEIAHFCNSVLRQLRFKQFNKSNYQTLRRFINEFVSGYQNTTNYRICTDQLGETIKMTDKMIANKHLQGTAIKAARAVAMYTLISKTLM